MPSFLLNFSAVRSHLRQAKCGVVLAGCFAFAAQAQALPSHTERARLATRVYRHAEVLRSHLLGRPKKTRTLGQYTLVLNAYRAVYHGDPAAAEAPKSIAAVAELLAIEGRQFHSKKDFHDAIAQEEFLRQQYPASPLRARALQSEVSIAHNDLRDTRLAARLHRESLHAARERKVVALAEHTTSPKIFTDHPPAEVTSKSSASFTSAAEANSFVDVDTDTVPEAAGSSMARVLGLRIHRIVIDAGHGGYDSGTLGPYGLEEKNIVLDVALRLGKLLQNRLGAEVVYTRRDDTYVPLEARTAIANRAKADLFLSIHANSSPDGDARGVETYFLNFTASSSALAVAARENAVSHRPVHELSDLVRQITLSDKMDESRTFAADVQQSLYHGLEHGNPGLHNRGVKQAPFVVLIGAHMPSILAEISFLTNNGDAAELRHPAYRQRIAESLYRGVAAYVESMGGVRIAENIH